MERLSLFFESWEFFQDAALGSTIAGALLGALGIYILLGRLVFLSAAMSQVASTGVVLAYWLPMLFMTTSSQGALETEHAKSTLFAPEWFSLVFTLIIISPVFGWLKRSRMPEAILAMLYLGGASITVLLGTQIIHEIQDIQQLLIGNAVLIAHKDFVGLCIMASLMIMAFCYAHRGLEATTFWPKTAQVAGISVRFLQIVKMALLTIAIAYTTRIMGALPVFALTCLPAMAARVLAPNLRIMFVIALIVGALSGFLGYVTSFVADLPVGPTQTAAAILFVAIIHIIRMIIHLPIFKKVSK